VQRLLVYAMMMRIVVMPSSTLERNGIMNPWHRYLHQYFTGKSDEEAVDSFNI
jgi:hypothetical protein